MQPRRNGRLSPRFSVGRRVAMDAYRRAFSLGSHAAMDAYRRVSLSVFVAVGRLSHRVLCVVFSAAGYGATTFSL